MDHSGRARLGRKTKELVKCLQPREIPIIDHADLDALGAQQLVDCGVRVVLNAADSITGRYPNLGPQLLSECGVSIIDCLGERVFELVQNGDYLRISGDKIYRGGELVARGRMLTPELIEQMMEQARKNLDLEVSKFVDNTIAHVQKEKDLILDRMIIPKIRTKLLDKHVVIVVRGASYRADLEAIAAYIEDMKPVLIGVDGGADALLEFGLKPDLIIGDMDSVTEEALRCGAEILVHAYQDGRSPGARRLSELDVDYKVFPAPGTSEDIALLLAYESGAQLFVAVGLHSNLIDFLEKGRQGMASTFLTRMKVGSILVDAKGVSRLYTGRSGLLHVPLLIAALIPVILLLALATSWRDLFRLFWLELRLFLGGL
ncbi:MAG: putative cytokinetic ring protein SteA [Limnochordia bacterium]